MQVNGFMLKESIRFRKSKCMASKQIFDDSLWTFNMVNDTISTTAFTEWLDDLKAVAELETAQQEYNLSCMVKDIEDNDISLARAVKAVGHLSLELRVLKDFIQMGKSSSRRSWMETNRVRSKDEEVAIRNLSIENGLQLSLNIQKELSHMRQAVAEANTQKVDINISNPSYLV